MNLSKGQRKTLRKIANRKNGGRGMLHFETVCKLEDKGLVIINGESSDDIEIKLTPTGEEWIMANDHL